MLRQGFLQCLNKSCRLGLCGIPKEPLTNCINGNTCVSLDFNLRAITSNSHVSIHKNHANDTSKYNNYQKHLSERQLLLRIKDDPDTFGTLTEEPMTEDEGDKCEREHFEDQPLMSQKLRTKQYADIIKEHIRNRKIKEAIDVLEIRMIKEDRVKPEAYIYNLVLGACGRVGYTKKAFALYNRMKQRGLKVMGGTYTALFNACSNSPWPDDGLSRAKHLRNIMIEKGHEANKLTYNAMIKAFGRCGDIKTAFELADEMIQKKIGIQTETINFLLQSCVSDKTAGFRHALLVWRKFVDKRIKPDIYSYNLLLRCVRECGLGDLESTQDVLNQILKTCENDQKMLEVTNRDNSLDVNVPKSSDEIVSNNEIMNCHPNLVSKKPVLGNLISLSKVTKPEDRLLLVGGMTGLLTDMLQNKCMPDVKTFTLLLDTTPNTSAAENQLLNKLRTCNITPDVDFYNMLIKRRCLRYDYDSAKAVLELLKQEKHRPDLVTYGVLAMSCKTVDEATDLVQSMNQAGYRLNKEILGAMFHQACHHNNFKYVMYLMDICLKEEVSVSKKTLDTLDEFKRKNKETSNDKTSIIAQKEGFKRGFKSFREKYESWLQVVKVDDTEDEHPWHQYRVLSETDTKHYKDKDVRFKAQHTSLYRQKQTPVKKEHKMHKKPKDNNKPVAIANRIQ